MTPGLLLEIALKSTAILLAAWIATVCMSRSSAAMRHLVWTGAFLMLLILPIAVVFGPTWNIAPRPAPAATTTYSEPAPTIPDLLVESPGSVRISPPEVAQVSAPPQNDSTFRSVNVPMSLVNIWFAGVMLFTLRLAIGLISAARIARHSTRIIDSDWSTSLGDAASALGLNRVVPILKNDRASVASTFGVLRPLVLVPMDSEQWDVRRRRMVLLHELAHVKRRDCLSQTLARLSWALYWFNPLMPFALARMSVEQEQACDDMVIAVGTPAADYAKELLEMARAFRSGALPEWATLSMARPSQFAERLAAILDHARDRRPSSRGLLALVALIVCAGVIPLGAARPAAMEFRQSSEKAPAFEVADVHVSPPDEKRSNVSWMVGGILRGEQYEIRHATMAELIQTAFGVADYKVFGGPSWLESDHFDVIARTPPSATPETAKIMLQTLLADRFGLKVHNDSKPVPVYTLTVGNGGPKLKQPDTSAPTGCQRSFLMNPSGRSGHSTVSCHNTTMAQFTEQLPQFGAGWLENRPVMDATKLEDSWDFDFKFASGGPAGAAADAADGNDGISLFDAVGKQLGLKLEGQNISMPVLVVDEVNEKPTDNPTGVGKRMAVPTEFEVADVKPLPPGSHESTFRIEPGGRLDASGSLMEIIGFAFDVDPRFRSDMLQGAPKWVELQHFHIVAKAPAGLLVDPSERGFVQSLSLKQYSPINPNTLATVRMMVRSLLANRFKLATHTEGRSATVYALVAPKGETKLKKADESEREGCKFHPAAAPAISNASAFRCQNTTMAELAQDFNTLPIFTPLRLDYPVIDTTGIQGGRDFILIYNREPQICNLTSDGHTICMPTSRPAPEAGDPVTAAEPGGLNLLESLQQELGLKLEKEKHTIPVILIDHVEQLHK